MIGVFLTRILQKRMTEGLSVFFCWAVIAVMAMGAVRTAEGGSGANPTEETAVRYLVMFKEGVSREASGEMLKAHAVKLVRWVGSNRSRIALVEIPEARHESVAEQLRKNVTITDVEREVTRSVDGE